MRYCKPISTVATLIIKPIGHRLLTFCCVLATFHLAAQCPITVDAGSDKYICQPMTPVQLNGSISGPYLSFQWTPTQRLAPSTSLTPTATVPVTTTFTLTGKAVEGSNLIDNGDFEQGPTGFTSSYVYSPGNLWPEGTYDITGNPQGSHANFRPCSDHTGGGQMMVINGAGAAGVDVWCSDVPVSPNTDYVFSVWATSVLSASPAILQFSINGVLLGSSFSLSSTTCAWSQFYAQWNSGPNSSATICLVNQNTALSGNDFAIDDIFFSPVCTETDEVTVHVINLAATATPTVMPCANATVTISGLGSSEGDHITYAWTTVGGGHIVSGENTLTPEVDKPGIYILTVTYDDGNVKCTKTATALVTVSPVAPVAAVPPHAELTCLVKSVEMSVVSSLPMPYSYHWGTSNGAIQGSNTDPECIATAAGQYTVTVTSAATGCTAVAQTAVIANTAPPTVRASGGPISCQNANGILSGFGSSTGAAFNYQWSTTNGAFAGPTNAINSLAARVGTYTLMITNTDNGCSAQTTTTVTSNFTPSTVNIAPSGNIDCRQSSVTLNAAAAPTNSVLRWIASNGGSIPSGQNSPTITVTTAGTYSVISTHPVSGCKDTAAAVVTVNTTPPLAQIARPDTLNCNKTSLVLSPNGTSTGTRFTYQWTASAGGRLVGRTDTLYPKVNASGVYTLLVTDTLNHCTATATATVLKDTLIVPVALATNDTLTCVRANASIAATHAPLPGGVGYVWTDTTGAILGRLASLTVQTPGLYRLVLQNNANGCTSSATVRVVVDKTPPTVSVAPPAVLNCQVNTVQLSAQTLPVGPPYRFQWTGPVGGLPQTAAPMVAAPGTYQVSVTNPSNGCTAIASAVVARDIAPPLAQIAPADTLTCARTLVRLNGTASANGATLSQTWSSPDGRLVGGTTTLTPTLDKPGTYILQVTNTQNHCTATATVQVPENKTLPQIEAGSTDTLDCRSPQLALQGQTLSPLPLAYQWSGPNIVSGDKTLTPVVSREGAYILVATNLSNGCTARDTVLVVDNALVPVVAIAVPDTFTCTLGTVALTANATGQGALQLQWSTTNGAFTGPQNAAQATVVKPGLYQISVFDVASGCAKVQTVAVLEDKVSPEIATETPAVLNCEISDVALGVRAVAPNKALMYQWSTSNGAILSGPSTAAPRIGKPGLYQVVATDPNNGCTTTTAVSVSQDTVAPLALIAPPKVLTCSTTQQLLDASASSNDHRMHYAWHTPNGHLVNGDTTMTPTIDKPGVYTLTVADQQNHCTASVTTTVLEDKVPPTVEAGRSDTINCGVLSVQLNGSATAQGALTYRWSGPSILNGQDTPTPLVGQTGVYKLRVTNTDNGCVAVDSVAVPENKIPPVLAIASPDTLTCVVRSIALRATATGQGLTLQPQWTPPTTNAGTGFNTLTPQAQTPGLYTLQVTDPANGCTTTATATLLENIAPPTLSIAPPDTITCARTTVALRATALGQSQALQIAWQSADGRFVSGQTALTPVVDRPGTYQVRITDPKNGCSAVETVVVAQNTVFPTVNAGPSLVLTCANTEIRLQGGGDQGPGIETIWSTLDGRILAGGNTLAPTINAPGTYTLSIGNRNNGCAATAQVAVTEDKAPPTVEAGRSDTINCGVLSVQLNGSATAQGALTYRWSGPSILNGQDTPAPLVGQTGVYTLRVTNTDNGCVAVDSVSVPENKIPPVLAIVRPDTLTCVVRSVALRATATGQGLALQPQWTPPAANAGTGFNTLTPQVQTPGLYTLQVTDPANGCTTTATTTLLENIAPPTLSIAPPDTITCARTTVALRATALGQSPALQIAWQSADGRFVSGQTALTPVVDRPGTYQVRITDPNNGCSAVKTVVVAQNAVFPNVNAGPSLILTCANTELRLQGQGDQGPGIETIWSTLDGRILAGGNTLAPTINAPGTYTLSIGNRNTGCTATAQVAVTEDKVPPFVEAGPNDTLKCSVPALQLLAQAAGSNADFEYEWTTTNGNFVGDPKQLQPTVDAPGVYLLTVRNRTNGCVSKDQVEIIRDARAPLADAGTAPKLTCVRRQFSLQGTASSGTGISYAWQTTGGQILGGDRTLQPLIGAAGVYQLLVTDANNGCKNLSTVTVEEDTIRPLVNAGPVQVLTCARQSLALQGMASAPSHPGVPLSLQWSTTGGNIAAGGNTLAPNINRPGTYALLVENTQNGCRNTHSVSVGMDTIAPMGAIAPPNILTCANLQVPLSATVLQPTLGNYTLRWLPQGAAHIVSGDTTLNPLVDRTGIYRLELRNRTNGCTATLSTTILEDKMPPLADAGSAVELTCAAPSRALDGKNSSQGAAYVYNWSGPQIVSGGTTLFPSISAPGNYVLTVRDTRNGCTKTANVLVTENKQSPKPVIAQAPLLTCSRDSLVLNAQASGNISTLKAAWATLDGHFRTGTNSLTPVVDRPGTYTLVLEDRQNGCTATTEIKVSEDKAPPGAQVAQAKPLSCVATSSSLQGSSASTRPVAYRWEALSGNGVISGNGTTTLMVNEPGTYRLTVSDPANGCTSTAEGTVLRLQGPRFQMEVEQPNCHAPLGSVSLQPTGGDAPPFQYILNGGVPQSFPYFENLPPSNYSVRMRDALGCTVEQIVSLKAPITPTLQLQQVDPLEFGDETQLVPRLNLPNSSIASWAWSPSEGLNCTDCPRPIAQPFYDTDYTLVITDLNGCTAQASVELRVSDDRKVWAPNIFSPNGDGTNDFFTLYGKGVETLRYVKVFDRWGNQVFLAEDIPANEDAAGWDGSFRGQSVVPAVFVWVAEVIFVDGQRQLLSGDVTVWR